MNDYTRATGGRIRTPQPVVDNRNTRTREPLTAAEHARAEAAKAFVLEHMPDLLPFIRDLVAEGLFPGWRGVGNCQLLSNDSK